MDVRMDKFDQLKSGERVNLDFSGVKVLSPSWADEFIKGLKSSYGDNVAFLNAENPSVKASLKAIAE